MVPSDDERALPIRQGGERLVVDGLDPARHHLGMVAQVRDVPDRLRLRGSWGDIPAVDDLMAKDGKRIGQACNPCGGGPQGGPGYAGRKTEGNADKANGFGRGLDVLLVMRSRRAMSWVGSSSVECRSISDPAIQQEANETIDLAKVLRIMGVILTKRHNACGSTKPTNV